jgi:hypothetical protein
MPMHFINNPVGQWYFNNTNNTPMDNFTFDIFNASSNNNNMYVGMTPRGHAYANISTSNYGLNGHGNSTNQTNMVNTMWSRGNGSPR